MGVDSSLEMEGPTSKKRKKNVHAICIFAQIMRVYKHVYMQNVN